MLTDIKILFPVLLCHGTELFVDVKAPSGIDGSTAKAFNKIQHAADIVKPGDTAVIKPGVYGIRS